MRERQYLKYNHFSERMDIQERISIKSEKRDLEHYRDTHLELIVLSCFRQVIIRNASYSKSYTYYDKKKCNKVMISNYLNFRKIQMNI